jgi:hypothetical protein
MTIELDDWDKDWLARNHTTEEYRRMCKELFERCAEYARQIDELKASRAPTARTSCSYPACTDSVGRCARLFGGDCAGPTTKVQP